MQVVHRDYRGGKVKVRVETLDDLYYLKELIVPGDIVHGVTYRKEDKKADKLRTEKLQRIRLYLGIQAETVEFHEYMDKLRVHGVIAQGNQDVGQYHTINVDITETITIEKAEWRAFHKDLLDRALKSGKAPLVAILCIDDEVAEFALLRSYGIEPLATVLGPGSGKFYKKVTSNDYYSETFQALQHAMKDHGKLPLLICGPGFWKEEFRSFMLDRDPNVTGPVAVEATGQSGRTGIYEALKSGLPSRLAEGARLEEETRIVDDFFAALARDDPVAYGIEETRKAFEAGAGERLVVTDTFLRDPLAEEFFRLAHDSAAEISVISTLHDGGARFQAIGGVAGFLRYSPE